MSQIDVTIMGQSYKLACKDEEQEALKQAALYVDQKMCAFRENTKLKGTDKIAVMAALTIAAELLAKKAPDGQASLADVHSRIHAMNKVLDGVLA
jgi:cell division protein ZapA